MKDAIGNDLKAGDLVLVNFERPQSYGRVMSIEEGGLVTGIRKGGADVRPSRLVVAFNHTIECDPRMPVPSVVVLRDPMPPAAEPDKGVLIEMPLPN